MRTTAIALILSALMATTFAQDKPPPQTFNLTQRYDAGFFYAATETERIDTTLHFDLAQKDDGTLRLTATATDRNTHSITREALAHDDSGALKKLSVEVRAHKLIQDRLKAGESAEEQTYNGDGPLLGCAWHEEWLANRWVRRQQKPARSPFGARPDELVKLLAVQHASRAHPLLPGEPVAVGQTWTPDTSELKARVEKFARWPEDAKPEIKAEGKLMRVLEEDGKRIAEVSVEVTAKGLVPAKSDAAVEWRKGATATLKLTGTLKVNLGDGFVQSAESSIEAELHGEVRVRGAWAKVDGAVKLTYALAVAREKKTE